MDAPVVVEASAGLVEDLGEDWVPRVEGGVAIGRGMFAIEARGGARLAGEDAFPGQVVWVETTNNDELLPMLRDEVDTGALLLTWAPFGVGTVGPSVSVGPKLASMRYVQYPDYLASANPGAPTVTPVLAVGVATRFGVEAWARRFGVRLCVGNFTTWLDEPNLYTWEGHDRVLVGEWHASVDFVGRLW
jgi:hypothetical protein